MLHTYKHINNAMKNWGLHFLCFYKSLWTILLGTKCLISMIRLTSDLKKKNVLALFLSRKVAFSLLQSRIWPCEKARRHALRENRCYFCLRKENWHPIGLTSVPFRLGPVGGPASQPSLFSCNECFCAAATGKHILLEEIKSLTIDKKIHVPYNRW